MRRRKFLRNFVALPAAAMGTGAVANLFGCAHPPAAPAPTPQAARPVPAPEAPSPSETDVVVVAGKDPYAQTLRAVDEMGGIEAFVKPGATVVLSPNLAFARGAESGASTHPQILRAMVDLCEKVGARHILVIDFVLDPVAKAFAISGASEALQGTRARLFSPSETSHFTPVNVSHLPTHVRHGIAQQVINEILTADTLISMPVIKHHGSTTLSGALKKGMGFISERRMYHRCQEIHACIAEMNTLFHPQLIIGDAVRVLQNNGPKGPGTITHPGHVLATKNAVKMDAFACRYFTEGEKVIPTAVEHIVRSATLEGTSFSNLRHREITV